MYGLGVSVAERVHKVVQDHLYKRIEDRHKQTYRQADKQTDKQIKAYRQVAPNRQTDTQTG